VREDSAELQKEGRGGGSSAQADLLPRARKEGNQRGPPRSIKPGRKLRKRILRPMRKENQKRRKAIGKGGEASAGLIISPERRAGGTNVDATLKLAKGEKGRESSPPKRGKINLIRAAEERRRGALNGLRGEKDRGSGVCKKQTRSCVVRKKSRDQART